MEHVEGTLPLPVEWTNGGETFLLKVSGGQHVALISSPETMCVGSALRMEMVVVTLMGEEVTVKRFFKKERRIELKPDNKSWEAIEVEEGRGELQILGKVIGVFRKC